MDRTDLFSRGATPPGQQPQQLQNHGNQYQPSATSQIDSLFHNLTVPADHQPQISAGYGPAEAPTPPLSMADDVSSTASTSNMPTTDRQNALLNLLGTVSSTGNSGVASSGVPAPAPIPSPPGASQRSGPSPNNNESQGKILLEQLMSGNAPRSNYSDSQRGAMPAAGPAPSPPYLATSTGSSLRDTDPYMPRVNTYDSHDTGRDTTQRSQLMPHQQSQQQPPQPPSPRKSMFDFVSPFDALASSSNPPVKKKPVPPQSSNLNNSMGSSGDESWNPHSNAGDPKRKSVENLMDQLTRGQGPPPASSAPPPYDPYMPSDEVNHSEQIQSRAPLPPLPKTERVPSPSSPPKVHAISRPQPRVADSPVGGQQQASQGPLNRREKEGSPVPRVGNWKSETRAKNGPPSKTKNQSTASPQAQSIVFDVSQPLDDVQSPRDTVKSTAIALVRQDTVFLPGTTIGATHWVAYAMTRGRVRVISRSSGDRTLLQLPSVFPNGSAVTDMAVYGNRLAGVTSDGGFVVWELPEVITDDVPGQLLLCVPPSNDSDALHAVKWHPKQEDTLAVASENKMYVLDLADAARLSRGQPILQSELHRIAQVFSVPSRLVAFDFDVLHFAIATISEDSMLTLWNIRDKVPFWSHKVRSEEIPSSLTFVDGGIVIGRKNGTIFQLLSGSNRSVLSTVKFVNSAQEDHEMFGHVNYDSRIQTLWVANSRRDSLIAFKINVDSSLVGEERGYFEQVVEFAGPKPTIHFVILTADADPSGEEAHAACVAAKLPPGELALVAFSVHSSGVDQILIRKEWYDSALASTPSKFPPYSPPQVPQISVAETKGQRLPSQMLSTGPSQNSIAPPRLRTPPSEEIEGDLVRDEGRIPEAKGPKGAKGKNVNWKDRSENNGEKSTKSSDPNILNESSLGQALSKEMRKTEENLHTRIARLIGKEMDKQHQRLEEARAHEQAEDFNRQETILKLISTELTRNTTRVVEAAVKNEVLLSVVPALEKVTKNEVKSALNEQIGRGLADFIQQSLPVEIEKLIVRPDISNHFAQLLSSNLTPLIERNIKEAITKNIIPAFSQQSAAMHQDVLRELRSEIHGVKKELIGWQNDAFRGQESLIRDLEHTVRSLADQVKFLSLNVPAPAPLHHQLQGHNSPGPSTQHSQSNMGSSHLRQQNIPTVNQPPPNYAPNHTSSFTQQSQPPTMHPNWFTTGIAAPQASHPAAPPPPPPAPLTQRTPPAAKAEEWDDTYLAVLGTQESRQLRELLSRSNPEIVMPLNGPGPLSQAVVLTLLHRLAAIVGETPPVDESFKSSLWWLQRAASTLNTNDPLISPYIPRVVPNVQSMLNTTKQRLAILPGGPQLLDAARTISDIQDTLNRKP